MRKIEEALEILVGLGMPKEQHNERSALCLLALVNLAPNGNWNEIESPLIGITPMMEFARNTYKKEYAPNTRETFRRQTIHQFVDAHIANLNPDQPDRPVNSPKTVYQIDSEVFDLIRTFGSTEWEDNLKTYLSGRTTLQERYSKKRQMPKIPVVLPGGHTLSLSSGSHSQLMKEIVEEFAPRFAPGSNLIYIGDTGEKMVFFDEDTLGSLGVKVDHHGKMPDVVLYFEEKNWLLLVEAVTSHGPVDPKRHEELAKLFQGIQAGLVYVTAFPSRSTMAKYVGAISWETEVWIAENPGHLIHFDGKRFLGPYEE